jgi:Lysine methyltransferase
LTRTFRFPFLSTGDHVSVTLRDGTIQDYDGVGVQTWGSSTVLSKDLCSRPSVYGLYAPSEPRRISVLELGSGTGLVGLVAAQVLARQGVPADVLLTDFHPLVLDNLKNNLAQNYRDLEASEVNVGIRELDWEAVTKAQLDNQDELYDVCLGADIVYAPEHAVWLASCVRRFLRKPVDGELHKPAFHLVIPLRPTHLTEVDSIREVFGRHDAVGEWQLAVLEELELEREDRGVGRADETRYVRWRVGWRRQGRD